MEKILALFYLISSFIFLFFPQIAGNWHTLALSATETVVIKTLFPMMVLTRLVSASPFFYKITSPLTKGRLWQTLCLSDTLFLPVIGGILSGFPTLARDAESLFEKGKITKYEAEKALVLASAPSPAFLIRLGGKSPLHGTVLFLISLTVSYFFARGIKTHKSKGTGSASPLTLPIALKSSAHSAFTVSANIIFFTFLSALFPIFTPVLELGSGSYLLSGNVLRSFLIGFGGISAFCQIKAEAPCLSAKRYLMARSVTGALFLAIDGATFLFFS